MKEFIIVIVYIPSRMGRQVAPQGIPAHQNQYQLCKLNQTKS